MPPFNSAQFQPIQVFFDLQIGQLQQIYQSPQLPVSMRFEMGGTPIVTFNLFDETGFQVEQAFKQNRNQDGFAQAKFRWGYNASNTSYDSGYYDFFLDKCKPSFGNNSFSWLLTGSTNLSHINSNNKMSGTLQEIVDKFCQIHNLQSQIDPPFGTTYLKDTGYIDADSTELVEMQHTKMVTENDWRYLLRIIEWARDQNGRGGYRVAIVSQNGQQTLKIVRPGDSSMSSSLTYKVQDQDSVVIKWEPDMDFTGSVLGAHDTQTNYYQRGVGDTAKNVFQQSVTQGFTTLQQTNEINPATRATPVQQDATKFQQFNSECSMEDQVKTNSVRSQVGSSQSPYAGANPGINNHVVSWMQSNAGTLTVLGDPQLTPYQYCDVQMNYPANYNPNSDSSQQHPSSGTYWIDNVIHEAGPGKCISTLSLTRTPPPTSQGGS